MYGYWKIYVCCWGDGRGEERGGGLKLKTGMVEQLGRELCNIWCYAAQKQYCIYAILKFKKMCWGGGGLRKKLKRGLRAIR